jgi:Family of unknown function (DUF6519)/Right handed beta helix region
MGGDYSRERFDPRKHYAGVLMEQGRVQLDADWNEMVAIFDRRFRAERVDTMGRAVVPRETPDAFRVRFDGSVLRFGRGRMYVHGLVAENHGDPASALELDPILGELRNKGEIDYSTQPNFASVGLHPLPTDKPYLVYLDVWQREVTFIEDPGIIEQAVGVDTTTRVQTVWQLRFLPNTDPTISATTPDDDPRLSALADIARPSAGRLSTGTGGPVSADIDPCIIPPNGGFRSLENQLYRVEIHSLGATSLNQVGLQVTPITFKWSRDNGAVVTPVLGVSADRLTITVALTGRDAVLRFNAGDWVEVTDDARGDEALPGFMRKVIHVDDDARTITLHKALPATAFPVDAGGKTQPARHTLARRWDQNGEVRDQKGKLLVDLSTTTPLDPNDDESIGVIPVPAGASAVVLESGIMIAFSTDPAGGNFRAFDYWTFAGRTADASIEILDKAPPRGLHHHIARLAVVDPIGKSAPDLRVLWPPAGASGGGGDCDFFVTAAQHNSGALTIQQALDQVRTTGGSVCLGAGTFYILEDALRVNAARGVTLHGKGSSTVLVRQSVTKLNSDSNPTVDPNAATVLRVTNTLGFAVRDLVIIDSFAVVQGAPGQGPPAILVQNVAGFTLERCFLLGVGHSSLNCPLVGLEGMVANAVIRENVFLADDGIAQTNNLFCAGLRVEDNLFSCQLCAINFSTTNLAVFGEGTRIARNTISGCVHAGMQVDGAVPSAAGFLIEGNQIEVAGTAIISRVSRAVIRGNVLRGKLVSQTDAALRTARQLPTGGLSPGSELEGSTNNNGISVVPGAFLPRLETCVIEGNTIGDFAQIGMALVSPIREMVVRNNLVERVGLQGILAEDRANLRLGVGEIRIEGNVVRDVSSDAGAAFCAGIAVSSARTATVVNNTVERVAFNNTAAPPGSIARGIRVITSLDVSIRGNRIADVGPKTVIANIANSICTEVWNAAGHADVSNNQVVYSDKDPNHNGAGGTGMTMVGFFDDTSFPTVAAPTEVIRNVRFPGSPAKVVYFYPDRVVSSPAWQTQIVTGNAFETLTQTGVLIINGTFTTFSNNQITILSFNPNTTDYLSLSSVGNAIVMGNNFNFFGVPFQTGPNVTVNAPVSVVIGNILKGHSYQASPNIPAANFLSNILGS